VLWFQAHFGEVSAGDGVSIDPVVRDALASVAVAPRVAAASCLHRLSQLLQASLCTRTGDTLTGYTLTSYNPDWLSALGPCNTLRCSSQSRTTLGLLIAYASRLACLLTLVFACLVHMLGTTPETDMESTQQLSTVMQQASRGHAGEQPASSEAEAAARLGSSLWRTLLGVAAAQRAGKAAQSAGSKEHRHRVRVVCGSARLPDLARCQYHPVASANHDVKATMTFSRTGNLGSARTVEDPSAGAGIAGIDAQVFTIP